MKRINPTTNLPYRAGDVRDTDGYIFRCYNMGKLRKDGLFTECWLHPDSYTAIKTAMRQRAKKRRDAAAFKRIAL